MERSTASTATSLESFGLKVSVGQPRPISRSQGHHWFPTILHRLNDGGILVGFSISPDQVPENLAEGWPHALLKSVDEGANWFLLSVVRGGLLEAFPSWQLRDGSLLGMQGAFLKYSGEAYFLEWRALDARTWEGPREVPVRFPEGVVEPHEGPGRRGAGLGLEGGILQMPNGDLLAEVDGKFRGDALGRLCLFRYADAAGCWSYVSTIGDPNVEGVNFDESDLALLPDGSLLTVIRTGGGKPMYQSKSTDGGQTWSRPRRMDVCGVRPRLRLMSHGVVACSYGRVTHPPSLGDQIVFSVDGGDTWMPPVTIYHGPSTGYTAILETIPGELLYVYDDQVFGWTENRRNQILAVRIQVERR